MDFTAAQAGDIVSRQMGESGPIMKLRVIKVNTQMLYCGPVEMDDAAACKAALIWTFDRKTGVEEDPGLGWGVAFGITGTNLVGVETKH